MRERERNLRRVRMNSKRKRGIVRMREIGRERKRERQ